MDPRCPNLCSCKGSNLSQGNTAHSGAGIPTLRYTGTGKAAHSAYGRKAGGRKAPGSLPRDRADSRIQELLEMFAFREKTKRLVGALSTGWQKKAMICAALLHDPKVLFLDEVTSGLDPQSAIALQDFTKRLCEQGVTVIWTTHYMGEPEKICDRVGIMFAGRLVQVGTPDELKHSVSELSLVEVETPDLSPTQLE